MSPTAIPSPAPPTSNGKAPPPSTKQSSTSTPTTVIPPSPSNEIPAWVKPDLTRLLHVERNPGAFTSRSLSLVSLPAHSIFARITNPSPATVAYSSVQASRTLHIELNCDLVYINHSCRPSLVFDMERWEVRVGDRDLKEGDELTFFYPSTEWEMDQPFECCCGEGGCRGWIEGAGKMGVEGLEGYWLNGHVREMLEERKNGMK